MSALIWNCEGHGLPTTGTRCSGYDIDKRNCSKTNNQYYGFNEDQKDNVWGCVSCFVKTSEGCRVVTINKPHCYFCQNYKNCKGTFKPSTGEGFWHLWICKRCIPNAGLKENDIRKGEKECSECNLSLEGNIDDAWIRPAVDPEEMNFASSESWFCTACKPATFNENNMLVCSNCDTGRDNKENALPILGVIMGGRQDQPIEID